jgi:FkbM family methyltransferase
LIRKIVSALRRRFFPTAEEKMLSKWYADGGDERFRFDYELNQNSIVLDLGGYKGQWASDIFGRYRCNIIAFEPVKRFAKKVKKRFEMNDKIQVNDVGLGGYSRKEVIGICADVSSIFRNSDETEEIMIVDIAEWINRNNIKSIDLMKINIEGGEYELLERLLDTGLIGIIQNIQIQFHNISKESNIRMEIIQKRLRETHIPTYQYKFIWENWKKLLPKSG